MDNGGTTSFLDLLFNLALYFALAFILMALSVKVESKNEEDGKKPKAEIIITVTWPNSHPADVDSYLLDPIGNIVMYKRKDDGLMLLDRDDVGDGEDVIVLPNGERIAYEENIEVTTIRGIIPGEYIFNIHLFSTKGSDLPIPVTIEIEKVNPILTVIYKTTIELKSEDQENTVARLHFNDEGMLTKISHESQPLATNPNIIMLLREDR
jgi:hypothetical protein